MGCNDTSTPSPSRHRFDGSEHLSAVLARVEDMHRRGQTDVESVLREINESSAAFVPGAQGVGITVLNRSGTLRTLGATDSYARQLDDIQRQTTEGPCLSSAWNQHTIHIDDLATERRWPRFREVTLAETPVRSVLSFRLFEERKDIAALNFHAESPGVFNEESIDLGLLAATHTMVAWNFMSRERQFRSALASRDVIGQAKGMLMERFSIDAVAAFELLKQLSQESNTKLADIAARLISGERSD